LEVVVKKITKKARIEKAREIIDRNEMDVPFPDGDVMEFAAVCQQPITAAIRRMNPMFPNDYRHLHTEIDGVWAARSWRKLISPISEEQQAKIIMRHCIWRDMRDYRDSASPQECASCGAKDDITVDHVAPPFDTIASEFMALHGVPKIEIPDDNFRVLDRFEDPELEGLWVHFHAERAVYQLLCRSCNASKGKRS
jgi:5-methylcytosine-specific restriction endonuclease McrA